MMQEMGHASAFASFAPRLTGARLQHGVMIFARACSGTLRPLSPTSPAKSAHFFATGPTWSQKALPPRPKLPDHEIHSRALKGSGPGGQKINKTTSAIQITHLPTGVVVKSQATRSRSQNYKIALEILAEKIELLQKGDESRAAKKIEVKSRKKASAAKKARRKYRKLEEKNAGKAAGERVGTDEVDEDAEDAEDAEEVEDGQVLPSDDKG